MKMQMHITPEMAIHINAAADRRGITASQVVRDILADRFNLLPNVPRKARKLKIKEMSDNAKVSGDFRGRDGRGDDPCRGKRDQ